MKVIKILFLVATAIIWGPFWIIWQVMKLAYKALMFLHKLGFTIESRRSW